MRSGTALCKTLQIQIQTLTTGLRLYQYCFPFTSLPHSLHILVLYVQLIVCEDDQSKENNVKLIGEDMPLGVW